MSYDSLKSGMRVALVLVLTSPHSKGLAMAAKIVSGVFQGFDCTLLGWSRERKQWKAIVTIFGRETNIWIDTTEFEVEGY